MEQTASIKVTIAARVKVGTLEPEAKEMAFKSIADLKHSAIGLLNANFRS